MQRITISGYYGYGNAGDEAVLAGLISGLRSQRGPETLEIVALSGQPAQTMAFHGIPAEDRYDPKALLRAIRKTELLISGGGSLLQDVTSGHSIFYYLGVVRLAQILGKKTMFVAQGIGPLIRPRTRRLVKSVANRLNAITVRDDASKALLEQIGVTRRRITVTADPALLLGCVEPPPPDGIARIGVALRPWQSHGGRIAEETARALFCALPQAQLSLLPMQPAHDEAVMEHFARIWHQLGGGTVQRIYPSHSDPLLSPLEAIIASFAACHMVVGMRLHAFILAAACGAPSVALSYDPKVSAFMSQSGQSDFVYNLESETSDLSVLIQAAWEGRTTRAAALSSLIPSLRAAALQNAEAALSLLPLR